MIWAWLVALTMQPGVRYEGWRWLAVARYVRRRQGWRCRSCRRRTLLHVHHKKPVSQGGGHLPLNLEGLCLACHERRHDFDIDGNGEVGR